VVDGHLIDDRHVELIENQILGDMAGEVGVTDHFGHRSRPETLVGDGVTLGASDGERR